MIHARYVFIVLHRYIAPVRYVSILFLQMYDACALCVYSVFTDV